MKKKVKFHVLIDPVLIGCREYIDRLNAAKQVVSDMVEAYCDFPEIESEGNAENVDI